jgi:phosphoribosylanthranilate isomerase
MKIKICGITEIETLNFLIENGVDYAGFIFHENSPRNVTHAFIKEIRNTDFHETRPVCVFANAEKSFVSSSLSYFENPIIQFHGDESEDFCKLFDCKFWKALRIKDSKSLEDMKHFKNAEAILCDTYKEGIYGGTGSSFDWEILNSDLFLDKKIILSGGLSIENLQNALKIEPWCLDFNSGVESSPGYKDHSKIVEILSLIKK